MQCCRISLAGNFGSAAHADSCGSCRSDLYRWSFELPHRPPLLGFAQILLDPFQAAAIAVGDVIALPQTVRLPRVHHELRWDVVALQPTHISIVDSSSNHVECLSVVVEMSPHHRPAAWNQANVEAVAKAHLPVRVTGQLFFDSSHTPCGGGVPTKGDPSRASLWEIHPIYKFEVCAKGDCSSGGWVPLTEWKAR